MKENNGIQAISELLHVKGSLKQDVYIKTKQVFHIFREVLQEYVEEINCGICKDDDYSVAYKENGKFESEIKFAGDMLFFNMHTNVFGFPNEYFVHQLPYVQENPMRQYCGMIEIYNFLADSFKYNRYYDSGFLIARVFINHEGHFFVEGDDQLGFLYKDFENLVINKEFVKLIVEACMKHAIEFDLWIPNYQTVKQITVGQKIEFSGNQVHKTSKRLGFDLEAIMKNE